MPGRASRIWPMTNSGVMSGSKRAWLEFRRNRFALVGTAFMVFITFMGVFAPIVSTHDPYAQSLAQAHEAADGGALAGHG